MLLGKRKPIMEIGKARVGNCNGKRRGKESLSETVIGHLGPQCPRQMGEPAQQWPCQGGQWPGAEQVKADWKEVRPERWQEMGGTVCRACWSLNYCN